jgi:hypothetical protein
MGLLDKIKTGMTAPKFGAKDAAAVAALTAVAAPVGLAYGGIRAGSAIAGGIKNRKLKPIKESKEMLAADLDRLNNDPDSLGLTQAQQDQMIGAAQQQSRATQQAQTAELSRSALAGQDFQAGALQEAAKGIADQGDQAAAAASANVQQMHRQLVQQEKARILGDLSAQRERARENTRFWTQFGFTAAGSLIGAALGNPASPLAGAASLGGGSGSANLTPEDAFDPASVEFSDSNAPDTQQFSGMS